MEIRLHLTLSVNWDKFDKVWKRRIHFKSDVSLLSPIAVVDANDATTKTSKNNRFNKHTNYGTCITLFRTLLRRFCTTTTSKYLTLRFMENVNKQRVKWQNFVSLFLEMVPSFNKVSARCRRVFGSLKKALIIDLTWDSPFPIMHLICCPPPPKKKKNITKQNKTNNCIRIVFNFSWDGCNTQEKWKTKDMQNFGG